MSSNQSYCTQYPYIRLWCCIDCVQRTQPGKEEKAHAAEMSAQKAQAHADQAKRDFEAVSTRFLTEFDRSGTQETAQVVLYSNQTTAQHGHDAVQVMACESDCSYFLCNAMACRFKAEKGGDLKQIMVNYVKLQVQPTHCPSPLHPSLHTPCPSPPRLPTAPPHSTLPSIHPSLHMRFRSLTSSVSSCGPSAPP
jgi:hypothetical protein